ncbi:hypothetical protein ABZ634_12310, partial [Nocardiopsis alba]
MSEQQRPEAETDAFVFSPRKNGQAQSVSDELAAWMRTGWADTEMRDLEPIEQAEHTARRRAALSEAFPGEHRGVTEEGRTGEGLGPMDRPDRLLRQFLGNV